MGLPGDVTEKLQAWSRGDQSALAELIPMVYEELCCIAEKYLRKERADHTIQTSALVHEAYIELTGQNEIECQNRKHFFAIAAKVMRRILVDYAVAKQTAKRGGKVYKIALDEINDLAEKQEIEIIRLNEALEALAVQDPKKCQLIELRFFVGLSIEETAELMNISVASANREWRLAKAWLCREVKR
ncbi:MAG: sigma-70 family RNA polymerase sigma factor [Blastocatellia bacterium]|nr:sigma-70 family RNA polymerase sigma factor [Blastocatellia bacterium]